MGEDAFGTNVSCYRTVTDDGKSHAIHPFDYLQQTQDPEVIAAKRRFLKAIDIDAIDALLDSVPSEAFGCTVLTAERRDAHKKTPPLPP